MTLFYLLSGTQLNINIHWLTISKSCSSWRGQLAVHNLTAGARIILASLHAGLRRIIVQHRPPFEPSHTHYDSTEYAVQEAREQRATHRCTAFEVEPKAIWIRV